MIFLRGNFVIICITQDFIDMIILMDLYHFYYYYYLYFSPEGRRRERESKEKEKRSRTRKKLKSVVVVPHPPLIMKPTEEGQVIDCHEVNHDELLE